MMKKQNILAGFILLLVFFLGAATGATLMGSFHKIKKHETKRCAPFGEKIRVFIDKELKGPLALSEMQEQEINRILLDTSRAFKELHKKARKDAYAIFERHTGEVESILEPAQQEHFQKNKKRYFKLFRKEFVKRNKPHKDHGGKKHKEKNHDDGK